MLNWLKPSARDGAFIQTQEEALEFLLKNGTILGQPKDIRLSPERKIQLFREMLERDLLPHVGHSFEKKALFLGYMVNKLLIASFPELSLMIAILIATSVLKHLVILWLFYSANISQN